MYRALFLPLMLSLALHLVILAEPLLLMQILSLGVHSPNVVEPTLQVTLVSPVEQLPLLQVAHGKKSGDSIRSEDTISRKDLLTDAPVSSLPELVEPVSPANTKLDTRNPTVVLNGAGTEPSSASVEMPLRSASGELSETPNAILNERKLPQQGELTYDLYWSKDHWLVGKATHRWATDSQGHYTLSSESKTTGIFALLSPLTIFDETYGQLTDQGMTPLRYVTRANDEPRVEVQFDWQAKRIRFYSNKVQRLALPLDGKVFDKLSFLYQLYLMRPKEPIFSVTITLGYRIEQYVIESIGEEEINTGLGSMNAVHLRRMNAGPGDDHVEVWLAPAMDYLPVKILFFNNRGQYYEQSINNIRYAAG